MESETSAKGVLVLVDANRSNGFVLPNVSSTLTIWNGRLIDWSRKNANAATYPISDFVEYVELMSATGGNAERDLLKAPDDKSVLDDYNFELLVRVCREILSIGAKPYLKLGNVPAKFSNDIDNGAFSVNIRPPADDLVHYRYMKACAAALKETFGIDEVRTWRFAVLTEADNPHWFATTDKNEAATRDAYLRLYSFTAKAFAEELGNGLCFGAHFLYPDDKVFFSKDSAALNYEQFFEYCEKTGTMLGLFTISYYSVPEHGIARAGVVARLADVVASAKAHGFHNLVTGVDEGRVIVSESGRDQKDLATRAVGQSYEAAFDVRVAKSVFNAKSSYFASWGFFSGPLAPFEGVPSFSYFTSREIALFAGMRRIDASLRGCPPPDEAIDAFAGISTDGETLRVAVSRFKDQLDFTETLETAIELSLPERFRGRDVNVETLTLDDGNNWFIDWLADRKRYGIRAEDFSWSGDDQAPLSGKGLLNADHRQLFTGKLQPAYAEKAAGIKPVKATLHVTDNGKVLIPLKFAGNGAAFVKII